MSRRGGELELAVLGLLGESPMHGYELRKRLNATLGPFRAFSYGSLYPLLKELLASDLVAADGQSTGSRSRIVYSLTASGKEHLAGLLTEAGPAAWDDDAFGVRLAFFGRTDAATRLRILEGRRSRLEERLADFRTSMLRTRERLDAYTIALQQHGLESVEREVRWLDDLISTERAGLAPGTRTAQLAPAVTAATDPGVGTSTPASPTIVAPDPARPRDPGTPPRLSPVQEKES